MAHLDAAHHQRLLRLAAHRKSFKKQALEIVCGSKDASAELRVVLMTRFLLNHYGGTFVLNPIVREISLARLREKPAEFQQAHSSAADYHLRPFKAKQTVGSQTKLGEAFAELRYHLVHAQRNEDLREVMHHFTSHLKLEISSVSPVPTDREELDERIGVLSILLEEGGAKGLEYHLAQCLKKRGRPGDMVQALIHATRATDSGAPGDSWVLRAQI